MEQLSINLDPEITKAYETCREYVASVVHKQGVPQKSIAADMDYSPSDLTRKLAQSPSDSRRFTLDDLEKFIEVTGDVSPVNYLVAKYLYQADREALEKQIMELNKRLEQMS